MSGGYILEIKTSSSDGGLGLLQNDVKNSGKVKSQLKGISGNDDDLRLRRDYVGKENSKKRKHHRKRSSSCVDKYIKFKVKKSTSNRHCNEEEDLINRLTKFIVIFISVGLIWHILNNVDPLGKIMGGDVRLKELNEMIISKYYHIIGDNIESDRKRNIIIEENREENSINNIGMIIEKVINGIKVGSREEFLVQDLISLVYLSISVMVINELYWRVYHEIEESLTIIPYLGVQTESILKKQNIWQVMKGVIGINKINSMYDNYNNNNNSNNTNEDEDDGIIINKQFVPIEYVKDIVINEGFKGFEVIFYMTMIMEEGVVINTKEEEEEEEDEKERNLKMIVIFPNLLPRRAILETVYRKSREYLKR